MTTSRRNRRPGAWKDYVKVTLLVTPDQDADLAALAYRHTRSRSEIARQALQEYFDRLPASQLQETMTA